MGKPSPQWCLSFGADLRGAATGRFPVGSRTRRTKVSKYLKWSVGLFAKLLERISTGVTGATQSPRNYSLHCVS
jgi:hypothetical protein